MTATPPLSGYLVVDLTSGIAGAYCTKLLADGGAEVVKVEGPGGDPLRRWSASGTTIPDGVDGALFGFLSASKQSVVADPEVASDLDGVRRLLARADAVIWTTGSPLTEHPSLSPEAIRRYAPHLAVTTITPFGLEGPWSDRAATEFTLQAWSGGVIGLGRGAPDLPPVSVGGQVGEWLTGTYAAIGAMAARERGRRDGTGELVDVAMLEALALCLTYYPVSYADTVGRPFRSGRSIVTPGVEATSDGLVGVGVGTGQQWLDFCVMVDHPEWMEDRKLFVNRGHLRPDIAAWMAEHTTAEVLELARTFRIPHAPIGNGATIAGTDHFEARGSIGRTGRGVVEPAPPCRFDPALLRSPGPAPHLGEHDTGGLVGRAAVEPEGSPAPIASADRADRADRADQPRPDRPPTDGDPTDRQPSDRHPYEGLRVLDLTAFWAGPLCTHVLGMLGAEVLHVESTARPDGTRLLAGVRTSEPDWWEQSGIFSGLNTNKQGITLDLTSERGRELLRDLVDTCDVVVENYTPRVLEQIGLDVASLRAARPELVIVRMPGFGLDGPWRDNPAFAFVIEDAAGLTWMTGHPDQNPVSPYCVGDSNAGLHALYGLLLALEHRRHTGEGTLVEAPMVDAALNIAAEQIVEYSAYGARLERDGNRGPAAAPQNLYRTADTDATGAQDSWVAIAVATDEQWGALQAALDQPDWASEPALATHAGRRLAHDAIDHHLAAWCAARGSDEIIERLWGVGVPVAKVLQPHEQATLAPLQDRGFFEPVDHPVTGTARHSTLPMRFSRGPETFHRRHAPLLGEHTREVLAGLGVAQDELDQLERDGVIGRAPASAKAAG